jgi:hypothetical protein
MMRVHEIIHDELGYREVPEQLFKHRVLWYNTTNGAFLNMRSEKMRDGMIMHPVWQTLQCCSCRRGETMSELQPPTGLLFIPQVIYEY